MTFDTFFLHESVGEVQIYSGTLVWSQYDYFESRGIDFSEITVSNQVFRRSKFLKKHFFWPRRLIFAGNGVFGEKWRNLEWFLEFLILRGTAEDQNCPKKGYFSCLKRHTVLEKDNIKWLPKWLLATILYKNHFKFH